MPPLDDAVKHFLALYCLPLVIAFGGVGLWIGVKAHDRDVAANAVLAERVQAEHQLVDRWKVRYARGASQVSHDSVVITRWNTKYHTSRDTVLAHITDTVMVREFVASADSTVHACTELLHSCSVFRVTADSTMTALNRENTVLRQAVTAQKPGFVAKVLPYVAFIGGVYVGQRLH